MTTNTDRFPVQVGHGLDALPDNEHHVSTTKHWTVHLRCDNGLGSPATNAGLIVQSGLDGLTGHMVGGDSFAEWCEPYNDATSDSMGQPGRALHVFFTTPDADVDQAWVLAQAIAGVIGTHQPENWALSTAGDWAEQVGEGTPNLPTSSAEYDRERALGDSITSGALTRVSEILTGLDHDGVGDVHTIHLTLDGRTGGARVTFETTLGEEFVIRNVAL